MQRQWLPAHTWLGIYCALLFCVPAALVVERIGSAGTPATLWGLLGLLWWACATVGGRGEAQRPSPVRWMLGLFALAILASYATAMSMGWYTSLAIKEIYSDIYDLVPPSAAQVRGTMIRAADRGLLAAGSWLGIAFLATDGLRTRDQLNRVIRWLTSAVAVLATVGVIQFYTGLNLSKFFVIPGLSVHFEFGRVIDRSVPRVVAMAIHPIEFGVVVGAALPLMLHRAAFQKSRWSIYCLAVTALAVPLSVSRSAILVAGIALLILFVGWPPAWRRRAVLIAPTVVVAVRLIAPGVVGTLRALFANLGSDPSVSGRTDDYGVVFRVVGESPWLGRGLYTFVPRYYRVLDNQFLLLLLELGIVGLCAFTALVTVAYFSARGSRLRSSDDEGRHLGLALSAALVGLIVSFATFDAFSFPMAAGLTFLLIGMSGAAWQISVDEREHEHNGDVRPTTGLTLDR